MAEQIYYSRVFGNTEIYAKVNYLMDIREFAEVRKTNRSFVDTLVDKSHRHSLGLKLAADEVPLEFFADKERSIKKLPEVFYANGYIVVQARVADVFMRFDMGETELVKVKILQNDRKTEVAGDFYLVNFGNIKDAFLPEKSTGLREAFRRDGYNFWSWPFVPKNDQIALSPLALNGSDIWHEKRLAEALFMSGRLRDALRAEKLDGPFEFFHCKVVEG